ncbi:MAG: cell division protein FtsA [Candidatus Lambdaproteobacteria bacterium RIFOXYD1_FULL_56_27]|uniref:Cell division protein FtsA n=1 Tax=Candidatus Lambdaproteobacteria bacterium RIFOXYD2_FULL_56_26 TaxID=1817773 RepID=A0A1F6H3V8_9PROT|nr:MAG: cell division protein FtsA [Candidatus Lambdaproteobacteria bacterium RIFOXYC1_FULL_56_13]OGH05045.1 MAG: cell division protein FtsA [Candidatus Lambdaproteobacteria bacterium RIFOXYD2_FULL_56_26]OGH09510.1 MAG: cell division protein FtsA [Candidatus Lambdaproteobacteria bacterium RIFOXYD1_FULL_56_27]
MRQVKRQDGRIVVGLDIGTTKICVVAAEITDRGKIRIIGFGQAPSEGLNRGVVTNISAAARSIRTAVEECQLKSGLEIDSVYAGIAGHHITGLNRDGVVAVRGDTITEQDIQRVIETARACNFPDKEILHTLCQEYIVDGQDGVKQPIGMAGRRLEARVHLILGSVTSAANIVQCCHNANLHVNNVVLEPLASSLAVLEEEEKELGVILLDIGGGTSDMVIYKNGSIVHTSVLPLGGHQVTNDIAIGLRTTKDEALRVKHECGIAMLSMVKESETVTLKGIAGREDRVLDKRLLASVVQARFEEIFGLILDDVRRSGYLPSIAAGVVLTGGSALMRGIAKLAEESMQMQVRIGTPTHIEGLEELVDSPIYATAVGLVKYAAENDLDTSFSKDANPEKIFTNVVGNMKNNLKGFFDLF